MDWEGIRQDEGGSWEIIGYLWMLQEGESLSLVCVPTIKLTMLQWTVPCPWSHRELWLNSMGHKINLRDMKVGKGLLGKKQGVDRGRRGEERAGCSHIMCCYPCVPRVLSFTDIICSRKTAMFPLSSGGLNNKYSTQNHMMGKLLGMNSQGCFLPIQTQAEKNSFPHSLYQQVNF